jgi:hypothetical protein
MTGTSSLYHIRQAENEAAARCISDLFRGEYRDIRMAGRGMKKAIIFATSIIIASTLAGCCGASPGTSPTASLQGAGEASFRHNAITQEPPEQLEEALSAADNLWTNAEGQLWGPVQSAYLAMKSGVRDFLSGEEAQSPAAEDVSNLSGAMDALGKEINLRNAHGAMQQANEAALCLLNIKDAFRSAVPTDTGRLTYRARKILLALDKGDWEGISQDAAREKDTWERVKSKLSSIHAKDSAICDEAVGALMQAVDARNGDAAEAACRSITDAAEKLKADFALDAQKK